VKILLVHNGYQQPGGEDIIVEQERRLLEGAGHQVIFYSRSNCEIEDYPALVRLSLVKQTVWATDTRRQVSRLLHEEKPQIVHMHNTFLMVSPSVYAACRDAGVPVVQTLHNYRLLCPATNFFRDGHACEECLEHSLWRGVFHGCYRDSRPATATVALMLGLNRKFGTWEEGVDCYIALTEFARNRFIAGGLPPDKVVVKPNFVQPDPGPRAGSGDYALFVGRLSPEKGPGILLEALNQLQGRIPLVIVGDGPLRAELESRAKQLRLASVCFRGRRTHEETIAAMQGARCLVLPSVCYENSPVCIAEAFACGTPVICSRLGAMAEIVADGRTGLHFIPGSGEDLATKLECAWANPKRNIEMGEEARAEYEAKFTAERNYRMLMEIYERALTSGRGPAQFQPASRALSFRYPTGSSPSTEISRTATGDS